MKNYISAFLISATLINITGCLKGDEPCTPKNVQSEQAAMTAFANSNGITATIHPSGINYQIVNQGSGPTPTVQSTLTANYVGKFLNGNIFDQSNGNPIVFNLSGVIAGWQIALPLIQKGGVIKMIIPSSLAYGCAGRGSIGPDQVLYFEVTLVDVQ